MLKTIKIAYLLFSIVVGIACFYGLLTIAFSTGDGWLSHKNPVLATWTGIALVLGVGGYLFLGMKLDRKLLPSALALMIFGLFVVLPAQQLFYSLEDAWNKHYASTHEDPYVVQMDRILHNSNLPMKLNLKSSNYDTFYYKGRISLNVEKNTEEPVTKTELNEFRELLPKAAKDINIVVAFGSISTETSRQESRVSFTISPEQDLEDCSASSGYESLCYIKDPLIDPSEMLYSTTISINSALPPFTFTVYGMREESLSHATRITVTNPVDNDKSIQELTFEATSTQDNDTFGLVLEDMNFDGVLDVRIQAGTPAGPNIPYHYWLWDVERSEFVRNSFLEEITSPEFNAITKLITSSGRSSAVEHFMNEYTYIKGIPTMTKRTVEQIDPQQKVIRTKVWDINSGEFMLTKDTTEPYAE